VRDDRRADREVLEQGAERRHGHVAGRVDVVVVVDLLDALVVRAGARVLQVQRGDVGVDLVDRGVQDDIEHVVDVERRRDRLRHLVDGQRLAEPDVLRLQALPVQAALDDVDDLLDLERLEDVVVRAILHRLDRALDRAEAGHDHGEDVDVLLGDLLEQLQPRHPRHLEVGDDEVVRADAQLDQRLLAVLHRADHVPLERQELREDLADHLLVVDDEDPRSLGRRRTDFTIRSPGRQKLARLGHGGLDPPPPSSPLP
jgi:hypothetical protein